MKASDKQELFDENGLSRGYYSAKNRLNELTGKEWVYWSKSVINKPYPPDASHKLRSCHGGQKPPALCADLIKVFTKKEAWVLDPFAGVGGTLLGAALCGRRASGIELDGQFAGIYRQACVLEQLAEQEFLEGDSHRQLPLLQAAGRRYDFLLTDVPYWNMDKAEKSKGTYKKVGQTARENRQSKLASFKTVSYTDKAHWLQTLEEVFRAALPLLKEGSYLAVFIGDMYNSGEYHFLSAELAACLQGLGLSMKANLIWYDVSKSLHVYGYQYQFIPSLIHQNILIFRNEKTGLK